MTANNRNICPLDTQGTIGGSVVGFMCFSLSYFRLSIAGSVSLFSEQHSRQKIMKNLIRRVALPGALGDPCHRQNYI